jgi:NTP pyrophosphatase (non-canonical NTP hydrolase)
MDKFEHLKSSIINFRDQRNWAQFHTLKHLTTGLSIEVAELAELMLWKTDDEVDELLKDASFKREFQEECADILNFLILISDAADFDLVEAGIEKVAVNDKKYPADKARNTAKKYDKL